MGNPPDALLRLVDRFDQDRKVFLSGDCKGEYFPKAKTPYGMTDDAGPEPRLLTAEHREAGCA
jgi:hypothetical protein